MITHTDPTDRPDGGRIDWVAVAIAVTAIGVSLANWAFGPGLPWYQAGLPAIALAAAWLGLHGYRRLAEGARAEQSRHRARQRRYDGMEAAFERMRKELDEIEQKPPSTGQGP